MVKWKKLERTWTVATYSDPFTSYDFLTKKFLSCVVLVTHPRTGSEITKTANYQVDQLEQAKAWCEQVLREYDMMINQRSGASGWNLDNCHCRVCQTSTG